MEESIRFCKEIGVYGVVFGITSGDHLDIEAISKLATLAKPLNVTVHKAIDGVSDAMGDLRKLCSIDEVHAVLTSGQESTALEGAAMLRDMISLSQGKIKIVVAGKVISGNINQLHQLIGDEEYHGRKIIG